MWQERTNKLSSLTSGLLLPDLPIIISFNQEESFSNYNFSIVLTQACDLESYYKAIDKITEDQDGIKSCSSTQIITQIMLCPAFDEDVFRAGEHLFNITGYKLTSKTKGDMDKIQKKNDQRYHYINSGTKDIPNFVIDFKHFFTLPINEVNSISDSQKSQFVLDHLYFTELSDRFAHYLQRVAIL